MVIASSRRFIPFGPWQPDSPDVDTDRLSIVKNFVQAFGGYRLVNKLTTRLNSGGSAGDDLTGAFSHLVVETRSNMLLVPDADIGINGWRDEDDGVTDIYRSVDEIVPSTGSYIKSEAEPSSDPVHFSLTNPPRDPADSSDHVLRMMYRVTGLDSGWTLDWDLLDNNVSVLTSVRQETETTEVDWTEVAYTLTSTEVNNFTTYTNPVASDYSQLQIKLTANGTGTASKVRPTADVEIANWNGNGGETEDLYDLIDQSANHIASDTLGSVGAKRHCEFEVAEPNGTPDTAGVWKIVAQMRTATGAATHVDGRITLREGGVNRATLDENITDDASFGTYEYTLTTNEKESISDFSALSVYIETERVGTGSAGHRLDVKEVYLELPSESQIEVAWCQFEVPDDNITTVDDTSQFFIGTTSDLYLSNGTTFDKVTRGSSDYGLTTTTPTAWDWCSYGDNIIATNFGDEVQVKAPSDDLFDDLITSTLKPNARFCMTVAGHLVLGDINDTAGSSVGQANEVWWSGLDAPDTFLEGDPTTGSDRQILYHTPGRITALTGRGDYGLAWKRDSVIRLDYVGDDITFEINVLSNGIGCPFPRSIVEVGADVFFCTGYSFARLSAGGIELIGEGEINKWFFDEDFEDYHFSQTASTDPVEQDQLLVGAYDRLTGNIVWSYYNEGTTNSIYAKRLAICYNTRTGAWTQLDHSTDGIQQIVPNLNIQQGSGTWRGVEFAHTSGGYQVRRFEEVRTYAAELRTAVMSSLSFTGEAGTDIHLNFVKPIIRTENADDTEFIPGGLELTVYYGETPNLNPETSESITVKYSDATLGLMPVNKRARYFQFHWNFPSVSELGLREFMAAEYYFQDAGAHG